MFPPPVSLFISFFDHSRLATCHALVRTSQISPAPLPPRILIRFVFWPLLWDASTDHFSFLKAPLKSVDISKLSDADVLFFFGTFCFKAHLSPQYLFKYGGPNGQSIGVRIMMYGHTVLVPADSPNVHVARVKASRQALLELQKHNPQWQIPPLPFSGSNDPKWNWSTFLSGKSSQGLGSFLSFFR